ncbi:hypothetical protein D3C79_421400 [compost metagenome]
MTTPIPVTSAAVLTPSDATLALVVVAIPASSRAVFMPYRVPTWMSELSTSVTIDRPRLAMESSRLFPWTIASAVLSPIPWVTDSMVL